MRLQPPNKRTDKRNAEPQKRIKGVYENQQGANTGAIAIRFI